MFKLIIRGESYKDLQNKIDELCSNRTCTQAVPIAQIEPVLVEVPKQIEEEQSQPELPDAQVPQTLEEKVTPAVQPTGLDSREFPWDARIHMASKKTNKDGSWTNRRGLDAKYIAEVEAELKGKPHVAPVIPLVPVPLVPEAPVIATPVVPLTMPVTYTNLVIPPPSPYAHTFDSFKANIASIMSELINEKKIDADYIKSLCEYFEVKDIWEVFFNDDKLAQMYTNFCETGLIVKVSNV